MTMKWRGISWIPMVALTALAVAMPAGTSTADEHGWNWTDARREGAVWTALALNRHLNPFSFSVEVNGGEAILTGTVDDEVKRDLAAEVAMGVDGIDRVTNNIEIEHAYEAAEDTQQRSIWVATTDASTTAAVKSRLLWNRNVHGMDIEVSTDKGVTTLEGEVATAEERDLAGELARNTTGVDGVNNELSVRAGLETRADEVAERADDLGDDVGDRAEDFGDAISDAWIRTKVKSSLLVTRNVPGASIQVRVNDGVVNLRGVLDSNDQKLLAIATAEDIRGVKRVDANDLLITN